MKTPFQRIILIAVICLLAGTTYAGVSMHTDDMAPEPKHDPKKKKPGEECKASDECQRHHSCEKKAEKSVCTATVHVNIPNT